MSDATNPVVAGFGVAVVAVVAVVVVVVVTTGGADVVTVVVGAGAGCAPFVVAVHALITAIPIRALTDTAQRTAISRFIFSPEGGLPCY
jgi:hypothetical protein